MISVVIPMYNSRDTIVACVQSVIDQTYDGLITIIVVNDGSKDDSLAILESAFACMPENRVMSIINKANGGVSSARNAGIKAARASWVALLDSDDIWLPKKLEKQISEIEKNPDIKFIGTNRNGEVYPFFNKSGQRVYSLSAKEVIAKWYPQSSTALISKELLSKTALYDESRSHAEDGDLWLKLACCSKLYVLNEDLVYTGGGKRSFGESGLSANMPKMHQGEILNIRGAKKRGQINYFEYAFFYVLLKIKYFRRFLIVGYGK